MLTTIGECCQIFAGSSAPQDQAVFVSDGVPFVRAGSLADLCHGGSLSNCEQISKEIGTKLKLKLAPAGTILFAKSGMSAMKDRVYCLPREAYVVSHLAALVPNKSVDSRYLTNWFNVNPPSRLIVDPAYPSIRLSVISNLEIDLPDLIHQKKIAKIYDKADEIIINSSRTRKIERDIVHSLFFEIFGDPATNPKNFDVHPLVDLYIDSKNGTKCGPFGSALKKNEYTKIGIPVWNMDNITKNGKFVDNPYLWINENKFAQLSNYSVKNGDVIISRAGTVGKMAVVRSDYVSSIISSNLIRVRFNASIVPEFFVYLMTICKGRIGRLRTGSDGSFTHMNTGVLDNLQIICPPLNLQNKFVSVIRELTAIEFKTQENVSKLVKKSLQQEMLR